MEMRSIYQQQILHSHNYSIQVLKSTAYMLKNN